MYPTEYPWDKWFAKAKRRPLRLERGVDFRCQPHSMNVLVRRHAIKRSLVASVNIQENIVVVRIH